MNLVALTWHWKIGNSLQKVDSDGELLREYRDGGGGGPRGKRKVEDTGDLKLCHFDLSETILRRAFGAPYSQTPDRSGITPDNAGDHAALGCIKKFKLNFQTPIKPTILCVFHEQPWTLSTSPVGRTELDVLHNTADRSALWRSQFRKTGECRSSP